MADGEAYKYATDQIVNYAKERKLMLQVLKLEDLLQVVSCVLFTRYSRLCLQENQINYLVVVKYQYDLEYGSNTLTMHKDAIKPGQRVLITDDLWQLVEPN